MQSHSEQLNELAKALAEAQAEFTAIPKNASNPFFKSSYAPLPQVVEIASPIITKHGLSVSQFLGHEGDEDTLTTWLMHNSGQYICQTMRLHLTKQDAQGQGSATTYARRYSYMAVLGLVADEDDDGNAASQSRPVQRQKVAEAPIAATDSAKPGTEISKKQLGMMQAKFDELGIEEREQKLAYVQTIIGRKVASSTELTKSEGVKVIDALIGALEDQQ